MEPNENRTLLNNDITNFSLEILFSPNPDMKFQELMDLLAVHFDRTEKRVSHNFLFTNRGGTMEVGKKEETDFVLVRESPPLNLTFSALRPSIHLQSTQYKDNSVYKPTLLLLVQALTSVASHLTVRRLGMRYVNEFKCSSRKHIGNFLSSAMAKSISTMASKPSVSRAIAVEEYNFEDSKLRLQYGIPNKFYPARLANFDIILDIDAFDDTEQPIHQIDAIASKLNHRAYQTFVASINTKLIEKLK